MAVTVYLVMGVPLSRAGAKVTLASPFAGEADTLDGAVGSPGITDTGADHALFVLFTKALTSTAYDWPFFRSETVQDKAPVVLQLTPLEGMTWYSVIVSPAGGVTAAQLTMADWSPGTTCTPVGVSEATVLPAPQAMPWPVTYERQITNSAAPAAVRLTTEPP